MRLIRDIGIDYSGAQIPENRIKCLQVYEARNGGMPERLATSAEGARNWTRLEVARFCASAIESVSEGKMASIVRLPS